MSASKRRARSSEGSTSKVAGASTPRGLKPYHFQFEEAIKLLGRDAVQGDRAAIDLLHSIAVHAIVNLEAAHPETLVDFASHRNIWPVVLVADVPASIQTAKETLAKLKVGSQSDDKILPRVMRSNTAFKNVAIHLLNTLRHLRFAVCEVNAALFGFVEKAESPNELTEDAIMQILSSGDPHFKVVQKQLDALVIELRLSKRWLYSDFITGPTETNRTKMLVLKEPIDGLEALPDFDARNFNSWFPKIAGLLDELTDNKVFDEKHGLRQKGESRLRQRTGSGQSEASLIREGIIEELRKTLKRLGATDT